MATLSQLPDVVDLDFVAGDTFKIRVRIVDPSAGTPQDLGSYQIRADIKKSYTDSAVVGGFAVLKGNGTPLYDEKETPTSVIPAGNTEVILYLSPAETMGLLAVSSTPNEFQGVWDLEVTFANGDVRTVAKGAVSCYIDVTKAGTSSP